MFKVIIISALLLLAPALADIYAAADFSGDGYQSSSSEGPNAKLYSSTTGPIDYSQVFDLKQGNYRTWAGLNGSGDFSVTTPEYDMDIRKASNLHVTAALNREIKVTDTLEEMEPEMGRIKLTDNLAHRSMVEISASGDGSLTEDIRIGSTATKSGMLHLWDFDSTGNFSFNRTMQLDGNESRERFEVLEPMDEEEVKKEDAA